MSLQWSHREEDNNLVDYFVEKEQGVLLKIATYNVKKDALTIYNTKENLDKILFNNVAGIISEDK
jgi:hypothetical protein